MLAEALTHRRGLSLLAGMLTGLTFPAAHVGVTVYPEMPAAACLAAAAYLILAQTECPLWRLWLGGLFIAPLPWLGLKYAPPGLLFLLLAGWVSRSHLLARARAFAVMCSPLALSVLGLSFYTRTLYGSYNPGSITGPMARHVLDRYNLTELAYSIQVFFGYFLDQKEGLLWKSPWMILALAAIPLAIKTWTRPLTVLVLTMTAHFAHYSYYTNWGLAGPPGRPVAAFCWVFALLLACGLSVKPFNRYFSWACVLSIISLLLTDLLYSDMSLLVLRYKWGDQPEWHPIFQWMSSVLPIPYAILPDYMTSPSHVLNLVAWALLTIILISVIGIKRIRSASPNRYMGLFIGSTLLAMLVQTPYLGKWIFEFHQAQKRSDIVQEGPLTVAPLLAGERLLPPVERKYRLRESRSMEFIAFTEQQPVSVQAKLSCTCPFSLWVDYFDQQQQLAGKEAAESNFDSNSFLQIDNYKCYYFGVRWNNKRKSKSRDDDDESESRGVFFQIINK